MHVRLIYALRVQASKSIKNGIHMNCTAWLTITAALLIAAGCGNSDSEKDHGNPASVHTDDTNTAADKAATSTDVTATPQSADTTIKDVETSADSNGLNTDEAFEPRLLLVHLPGALEPERGRVPEGYTGWVKDFRGDGAFSLTQYVDGERHGKEVQFYNMTQPMAAFYQIEGKIEGIYRFWNREGEMTKSYYKDGQQIEE